MKKDSRKDIMVMGIFYYTCEKCKQRFPVFLEDGVEMTSGTRERQPCPFTLVHECGGLTHHSNWTQDVRLPGPRPLPRGAIFFAYDEEKGEEGAGILSVSVL